MTTTIAPTSSEDRARQARIDAVTRLCAIAQVGYDPATVVARPHFVPVLVRDAMCAAHLPAMSGPLTTCGRCSQPSGGGHDTTVLAEVAALAPVAQGRPWAVLDVLHDGLPDRPDDPSDTAADLIAALEGMLDHA